MQLDKDLTKLNYIGKVIYNKDPDYSGRCKVRIFGLMDDLEDNLIPWFSPMTVCTFSSDLGGGNFSVPKIGAFVRVRFANNDIYSGEYTSVQNIDPGVFEGEDGLSKDDYEGTHVLLYDQEQELLIAFQKGSGFTIYYRESKVNIAPNNIITVATPNNNSVITLNNDTTSIVTKNEINVTSSAAVNVNSDVVNINGNSVAVGTGANVPAVNGNALVSVLTSMAEAISMKMPQTPGTPNPSSFSSILSTSVTLSK